MRSATLAFLGIFLAASSACLAAETGLEGASWIWFAPEGADPSPDQPAGRCYFRMSMNVSEQAPVKRGELVITADNLYTVFINGKAVAEGHPEPNAWSQPKRFDIAKLLMPGHNLIAVEAVNTAPGPAGLIAKISVELTDGFAITRVTDKQWKCSETAAANWQMPDFDDNPWPAATVMANLGEPPWAAVNAASPLEPAGDAPLKVKALADRLLQDRGMRAQRDANRRIVERQPPADFCWPEAIAFVGEDCSLYPIGGTNTAKDSLSVTVFTARRSQAYPEHDLPAPIKVGRTLCLMRPARPGVAPRVIVNAGTGALGSPASSYDGKWIYFSMAKEGEPFFHLYRVASDGAAEPQRLTDGPFHDIDPAEMPDGRIVFTSTRIGMFDEYHNPPSRALFTMLPDGRDIKPLTNTFVFDNEPRITADGRVLFIRSDNFFDRGKVETLLHAMHPDGVTGYTEFGLENGPEYGGRLRAFYCGSPAPMPDGRVAFVSAPGITVGRPGEPATAWRHLQFEAGDVAALPDGRLLCTMACHTGGDPKPAKKGKKKLVGGMDYEKIGVVDPDDSRGGFALLLDAEGEAIHSPICLDARRRPPLLPHLVDEKQEGRPTATGVFYCQDARLTKNTTAGWQHVRAIRVLGGKGLTLRSSHSYLVHAGSEVVELGTVPLAADGSFSVEVPADMAIAFQAVDAEGRSELNEMSWIFVRPGERRGCVGCHHTRQSAPQITRNFPSALKVPPLRLTGQGEPHRFRGNNAAVTGLMELQWDRYREVASLNRHSKSADPLATGAQEVAALCAKLTDADEGMRMSAASRLAIFRDHAVAKPLAASLRDPNRETRVAAAMALAACGTRESVAPLLEALADTDPLVRQAAAVALGNITGHNQPFDAFAIAGTRASAGEEWRAWLAANDFPAIEAALIARLAETDRDVQRRAAVALGHIGGDRARAALREFVAAQRTRNPYPEWKNSHGGDGTQFNSLSEANPRCLQEAVRALGHLKDAEAVPLLSETLAAHSDPHKSNLFLAEACAEALGMIGTPEAEAALLAALPRLQDYFHYVGWYGDHPALFACHASPVHYLIAQSLDAMGSTKTGPLAANLIRSAPTDVDRALMLETDDCEAIIGRVIRRGGEEKTVVETCLAILGDPQAQAVKEIQTAIGTTYQAWGGKPQPENRAAQVLSMVCRDREYEPRIRAAFERYSARPNGELPRVFDTGIPVVHTLPIKHWVCFFLARTLGNLEDPRSVDSLINVLANSPPEASLGYPDPTGPGVLFLHNDLTPCWRAAASWALGRIGDRRAMPALIKLAGDLSNAVDTRHAAAEAIGRLAGPEDAAAIRELADACPDISPRKALLRACARR